jgi:antitoxin component HigA of HigAB toxin-antitoxin module
MEIKPIRTEADYEDALSEIERLMDAHRVSEIMNRRRRLTLSMIRRREAGTGIPATVLVQKYDLVPAPHFALTSQTVAPPR